MRILIVGAGAVGQVYGRALAAGGAEVSFLVKERHAEEARRGFTLWSLSRWRAPARQRFEGFGVMTGAEEARSSRWDQVWLAVSATAVAGGWLDELVDSTGDATVVCLQPGPGALARVREAAGDRVVQGLITFIAYQAPLPREARILEPGIAYWIPPGPAPFSGPEERVRPLIDALRRGGMSARRLADVGRMSLHGTAFFQAFVAAIDAGGWSFRGARRGDALALAIRAFRETSAVAAATLGVPVPAWAGLLSPGLAKLTLWLAPRLVPIDIPTYFAYHFTKVGDQTRAHLDHWIAEGRRVGLGMAATEELRGRLGPAARFDPAADYS